MAPTAMRAKKSEEVLKGKEINANLLAEAGQVASEEAGTLTEQASKGYKKKLVRILAKEVSDQYRRDLMKVLVKRAVEEALERAKRA
jgi:CO/xanthine dehydrogenase FAD-binding subunit